MVVQVAVTSLSPCCNHDKRIVYLGMEQRGFYDEKKLTRRVEEGGVCVSEKRKEERPRCGEVLLKYRHHTRPQARCARCHIFPAMYRTAPEMTSESSSIRKTIVCRPSYYGSGLVTRAAVGWMTDTVSGRLHWSPSRSMCPK